MRIRMKTPFTGRMTSRSMTRSRSAICSADGDVSSSNWRNRCHVCHRNRLRHDSIMSVWKAHCHALDSLQGRRPPGEYLLLTDAPHSSHRLKMSNESMAYPLSPSGERVGVRGPPSKYLSPTTCPACGGLNTYASLGRSSLSSL